MGVHARFEGPTMTSFETCLGIGDTAGPRLRLGLNEDDRRGYLRTDTATGETSSQSIPRRWYCSKCALVSMIRPVQGCD